MSLRTITLGVLSTCFAFSMHAEETTQVKSVVVQQETTEDSGEELGVVETLLQNRPEGKRWYIEVSAGYGIPFLPVNKRSPLMEIGDKDWYQRNKKELSVKPLFGTNGAGWAGNFTVGHMFNRNVGIDATFTIAKHPTKLDARMDVLNATTHYFASQRTGTNAAYFAPHLVMKSNKGKFGVTGKAGLFIPFYGNTVSYAKIRDKSGRMIQTLTGLNLPAKGLVDIDFQAKTSTVYSPTVGVSTSIAFDYLLQDNITLFAQARVAAYTISLKETTFDELTMSTKILGIEIEELGQLQTRIRHVSEAPEYLRKIVYRKELTEKSNTGRYGGEVDMNKPMDELGIKYNASSLYFNVGVMIGFNKAEKRLNRRHNKKLAKANQK